MSRKRHDSVEPYLRRDLRRKENQFMLPLPPEGLTASGKRKWRDDELRKMWMPTGVSQATSSTPAAPAAPVPKASTRARAGAAYWPKRPKGQFLTRLGRWFRFGWLRKGTSLLTLLLAVALSGRRGPVMQFARIIGAAADLSESTADVAVSASGASQLMPANGLTTGANLTYGREWIFMTCMLIAAMGSCSLMVLILWQVGSIPAKQQHWCRVWMHIYVGSYRQPVNPSTLQFP